MEEQNGNGKTKESADNGLTSETDEEEIVPATPVNRKKKEEKQPRCWNRWGRNSAHHSSKEREGKQPHYWIHEEPVGKKGRYVNNSKSLGGKSHPFIDSDDDGDRGQNIGSVFTSADRDLLIRIEKRLEQIVFPEEIQQL